MVSQSRQKAASNCNSEMLLRYFLVGNRGRKPTLTRFAIQRTLQILGASARRTALLSTHGGH